MEPMTALFGVMAAIPQLIGAAKDLYDLRSRYKDASVLITAIYSESMVIAASLSQIQLLLQHDAMQSKPQLLETFDRALTGCRVVYGCLEEEVRELAEKAENDSLKFKDRAKFLWKEDTFKELLTQIRGQQSALSLLIQGLQMESIADIRQLVSDNSATLDQVVKRSKTLRQSHPRVVVPESVFGAETPVDERAVADVESIAKSTEFAFDDQVINSKAYRRAMALYASRNREIPTQEKESESLEDGTTALVSTTDNDGTGPRTFDTVEISNLDKINDSAKPGAGDPEKLEAEAVLDQLDFLEQQMLPFMPAKVWQSSTSLHFPKDIHDEPTNLDENPDSNTEELGLMEENEAIEEALPPLPPRRPSTMPPVTTPSKSYSVSSNDSSSTSYAPSVVSKVSTASSHTFYESSEHGSSTTTLKHRKPLPRTDSQTHDPTRSTNDFTTVTGSLINTSISLSEPKMNMIWLAMLENERNFIDRLTKFHSAFYTSVATKWPVLQRHLGVITIGVSIAQLHRTIILAAMERAISDTSNPAFDPSVFEHWAHDARKLYFEYCSGLPHAVCSLRTTQKLDSKFAAFVNTLGLRILWFGKTWEDYLKLPTAQLSFYLESLQSMINTLETSNDPSTPQNTIHLQHILQTISSFHSTTISVLADAQSKEDMQSLEKRIYTLNSDFLSQLQLLHPARRVRCQGSLAIKLHSQGVWTPVYAILLDNYLLWGKVKGGKKGKGEQICVLDAPIQTSDLEVGRPDDEHQFQKSGIFDEVPRGSVLYIINVKCRTDLTKPHMLGTYGWQDRRDWWEQLSAVAGE